MWNNHFQSTIKVNNDHENIVDACSEASKAQSDEDTFEFKRPNPPPIGKTYSRLRSLVDRPVKRSSSNPKFVKPPPGLHFLESFRQRQRAKLKKFQSFPSLPSSNASLTVATSSFSAPSLWSTSTPAKDVNVPSTSTTDTTESSSEGSGSLSSLELPPLRRSKAMPMSLPSWSFPAPIPTKSDHNTDGIRRLLDSTSSGSNEDNEEGWVGICRMESSPSEDLEMEICSDYTTAETESSKEDFIATSEIENGFPIPTLISGQANYPVFLEPRSPPGFVFADYEMDDENRNNNDTDDKEFQWSEDQLEILESAKRKITVLVNEELRALETGKPCSKMQVRARLEKANAGFDFLARGEHRHAKLSTCDDQFEGMPATVREAPKVKFNRKLGSKKD